MDWNIGQAKQRFSEVIRAAELEHAWRRQQRWSIGAEFAELRALCAAEDYELPVLPREDRANSFADALDAETR